MATTPPETLPPIIAALVQHDRPQPMTKEEQHRVVSFFHAVRIGLPFLMVELRGYQERVVACVKGPVIGWDDLNAVLEAAGELDLKVSVKTEDHGDHAAAFLLVAPAPPEPPEPVEHEPPAATSTGETLH